MAACLITITGTNGKVLLKYKESGLAKSLLAEKGNLYLDDATVTDFTYSTIYGDLVVSSACFTITSLPMTCYEISWDMNNLIGYSVVNVDLDGEIIPISLVPFPSSNYGLVTAINGLNDDRIKIIQTKSTYSAGVSNTSMIIKSLSINPPKFKIMSSDGLDSLYLIGESSACSIIGYTNINLCQPEILP